MNTRVHALLAFCQNPGSLDGVLELHGPCPRNGRQSRPRRQHERHMRSLLLGQLGQQLHYYVAGVEHLFVLPCGFLVATRNTPAPAAPPRAITAAATSGWTTPCGHGARQEGGQGFSSGACAGAWKPGGYVRTVARPCPPGSLRGQRAPCKG